MDRGGNNVISEIIQKIKFTGYITVLDIGLESSNICILF